MTDWKPQVVIIESVRNHPDADALDICTVLGDYPVITKRDEYQVGDLAGYIPIDSIVPDTDQFYFLCPKTYEKYEDEQGNVQQRQLGPKYPVGSVPEKYRIIKAKRIRGTYSQGMLVKEWYSENVPGVNFDIEAEPGTSLLDGGFGTLSLLKKWEEPEEENLPDMKRKRAPQAAPPKGWSIPYYDIDGIRKYLICLQEGEEIVLTEKLHGCLKYDTRITYFNGAKKPICQVKEGDLLLGMKDGKVVPSIVLHKYNNGKGGKWLKIEGTREHAGRGGNKFSITCTEEHRFYDPISNSYKRAKELAIGDCVQVLRMDYSMSPLRSSNEYKPAFVTQKITSISPIDNPKSFKYDLETETHNYIANGLVVHNSNAGFSHDGEKLWVKSRNFYKKFDEDDMWWDIAIRYNLESKLAKYPGLVFFGEAYGQVKGFRYDTVIEGGRLLPKIRFFDIWDTLQMRYLDYEKRLEILQELGLDPVPELYRGPWLGKEHAYQFAEGMSTLNPKHIREGAVLVPIKERYEPRLDGRLQLKIIGEGYNLQK